MLLIEEELRSVGERLSELECRLAAPRRPSGASSSWSSGLTSDDVADRLSLSAKTVEWNLTKVCRKLGVDSAEELAALLRPNDGETPGGSLSGSQPKSQDEDGGES